MGDTVVNNFELRLNLCVGFGNRKSQLIRTDWLWLLVDYESRLCSKHSGGSANFLRRVKDYCADSQSTNPVLTFPHTEGLNCWDMKVSLPRTSAAYRCVSSVHCFLVTSLSDFWWNCLEYCWYKKRLSRSYFTKATPPQDDSKRQKILGWTLVLQALSWSCFVFQILARNSGEQVCTKFHLMIVQSTLKVGETVWSAT